MDNELPSKTTEAKAARLLSEAPCAWRLFLRSLKGGDGRVELGLPVPCLGCSGYAFLKSIKWLCKALETLCNYHPENYSCHVLIPSSQHASIGFLLPATLLCDISGVLGTVLPPHCWVWKRKGAEISYGDPSVRRTLVQGERAGRISDIETWGGSVSLWGWYHFL